MTHQADTSSGEPPTGEELDALLERALGVAPGSGRRGPAYDPPPTPAPRPRRHAGAGRGVGRGRLLAGVALVAVLAAGYVLLGGVGGEGRSGEASASAHPAAARTAGGSLPATTSAATLAGRSTPHPPDLLARLPASLAARCREAPGLDPVAVEAVVCTPGGKLALLELRSFASNDALLARYRAVAGAEEGAGGGPRCARGGVEERAWAAPSAPDRRAGRYACRTSGAAGSGAAVLWWSSEASLVIGRAVAADDDLGGLFDWWRSAPESLIAPARAS